MTWNNDSYGLVCSIPEAKLYLPTHTWQMKLSQLHRQGDALLRLSTYALDFRMAQSIFERRPHHIRILCNVQSEIEARALANELPEIEIMVTRKVIRVGLVLIEPATVYIGGSHFASNAPTEIVVGLRSERAHDYYAEWFDQQFKQGKRVP